jgi:fructose-specific phosphotransferase system IIC component
MKETFYRLSQTDTLSVIAGDMLTAAGVLLGAPAILETAAANNWSIWNYSTAELVDLGVFTLGTLTLIGVAFFSFSVASGPALLFSIFSLGCSIYRAN